MISINQSINQSENQKSFHQYIRNWFLLSLKLLLLISLPFCALTSTTIFFFFFFKKKSRYSDLRTTTKRRRRQRRDCFAVVWKDRHSKKNRRSFHSFSCWMQILLFTVVPHWLNSFSIFNRSYPVLCTHQITNIIYA